MTCHRLLHLCCCHFYCFAARLLRGSSVARKYRTTDFTPHCLQLLQTEFIRKSLRSTPALPKCPATSPSPNPTPHSLRRAHISTVEVAVAAQETTDDTPPSNSHPAPTQPAQPLEPHYPDPSPSEPWHQGVADQAICFGQRPSRRRRCSSSTRRW